MIRGLWYDVFGGTVLDRALRVRRRSPSWLRAGVVFIHVPKAAGTSVSEAVYGRFLGHIRAADVERWSSPAVRKLPRVAVIRNPWDRLVSAYRFVKRGSGVGGLSAGGVWRPEQYQTDAFDSFERFVREWLCTRDIRKLDYVFQPQSLFVCDEHENIIVRHLCRFENLAEAHRVLEIFVPDLPPLGRSNRSGTRVDYRKFYTPELAKLVGRIYEDDARNLGYRFGD